MMCCFVCRPLAQMDKLPVKFFYYAGLREMQSHF